MRTRSLLLGLLLAVGTPAVAAETRDHAGRTHLVAAENIEATTFAEMMEAAMARMHVGMAAAKPTGDPDRDFAAMMIPHHQGAIDMAEIQLRFGRDERLRRLAQGIIVEQRQEITVMQRILDELPSTTAPGAQPPILSHDHVPDHKELLK